MKSVYRLLLLVAVFVTMGSWSLAQLSGMKTINNTQPTTGDNYASFTAAFNALNSQGVGGGGVTFDVSAGQTFTENPPELITTATAGGPVVFQKSGAGSNPKIVPSTPGTIASSTTIGANGDGIVVINGGDYLTFDGIDLQTDSTFTGVGMFEYGYYTKKASGTDACKNVTIKNCSITLNKAAIYSFGVFISNISGTTSVTVTSTDGRSENIKLHNLTISNSYGGIQVRGFLAAAPYDFYDQNIDIGVDGPNSITNYGGAGSTAYGIYAIYQNNLKLANNTINSGSGSTSTVYGMFTSTGNNSNIDIYGNTITVTGGGTTSALYGISNATGGSGTTNVVNIYNNTITGCTYPTATSATTYLLYSTATSNKINIYGNTVTGNSIAGTGGLYCIYGSGAVVDSVNIHHNTVTNNSKLSTGSIYCLYNSPASTAISDVHDNDVHGNTTAGGTVYGIYGDAGSITHVYRNMVYDQSTTAGTSPIVYGIYTSTAATVRIYNNFVSDLRALVSTSSNAISGIYISSGTNVGAYYNTIYLKATSSSATTFGTSGIYASTTPTVDLRNNIIVNLSDPGPTGGATVAYRRSSATLTSYAAESNNNAFFVDPALGIRRYFYGEGTGAAVANADSLFSDYKVRVAPRDANSVRENPPFINVAATPYNLHINTATPTAMESGGTPVTTPIAITEDYDGNTRNATTPDIGADEFAGIPGDLTPPVIIVSALGNTTAGTVQTLHATITDQSGIPTSGIGLPVAYWKRNSGGTYAAATGTYTANNIFDFSFGAGTVTGDTVYYFVAAQDSANNVAVSPSSGAGGLTPNPPAASTPPTNPERYLVLPPLAGGTYTVGTTTGTYATLKAAFDVVNGSALTGNVTFSILNEGTSEAATAQLNEVSYGPGGPYTIVVKPAASASPTITGAVPGALIKLNGSDNITIDGSNTNGGSTRDLTLSNMATTTNTGVVWVGSLGAGAGAMNVTIKNCRLTAGRNDTTNTFGVYAASADTVTSSGTGADNHNLVVENNQIERARFAVFSRGTTPGGLQTGLIIRNNEMGSETAGYELSYRPIDIANTTGALISGNHIFNVLQPLGFTITGIHLDVNVADAMIAGNKLEKFHQTNTGTFGALGININTSTGSSNNTIVNNMISNLRNDGGGTSTASNPFGIRIAGGANHKVYYNSVSLSDSFFNMTTSDLSAAFIVTVSTATGLDIRDNIFSNTMVGGGTTKAYGIYAVSASTIFGTINNNDYYVAGPNGVLGRQGTTDVPDLAGWRTFTGQDLSSVNGDPYFLDARANLHIDSTQSSIVGDAGTPIAGITTDIDGNTRSATTPDIGADEYAMPAPALSGNYNVGAGGQFPTLDSAFATLQARGVSGPVSFVLTDSLYRPVFTTGERDAAIALAPATALLDPADPLAAGRGNETLQTDSPAIVGVTLVGPISGASATNRITVRPATGTNVRIVGTGSATFLLQNVSYMTFDGIGTTGATQMSIENTGSGGVAIGMVGNSDNNIVRNLTLRALYANGIAVYADTAFGAAPDSLQMQNNVIPVTSRGLYLRGGTPGSFGSSITGNVIGGDSIGAIGIYNQQADGSIIANNTIQNVVDASAAGSNTAGLWIATKQMNMRIYNNVIVGVRNRPGATASVFVAGIYFFGTAGDTSRSMIYNNMFYDLDNQSTSSTSTIRGMYISTGISDVVAYNSVYVTGSDAATAISSAINVGSPLLLTLRNNLGINTRMATGTGRSLGHYALNTTATYTSNYNDLYVPSQTGSHVAAVASTNYTTLANWQATGRDSNSVSVMANFRTPHLHIDSTIVTPLNGGGTPVAGITTDIDGQSRNVSTPDIGADEFGDAAPPTPGWTMQTSGTTNRFYSVDAVSPTVAWAAGLSGVAVRTVNGGNTWTSVAGPAIGTSTIYNVAAVDGNTAFLTTTPSTTTFIFRTTNGGTTWDTVFSQAGGFINAIHMYDATNGIAMGDPVGGTWVILRTTDGGTTWARIATEPAQVGTEAGTQNNLVTVGTNNIWFGSSANGRVYHSTDAGVTWTSGTMPGATATTRVISVWFNDANYGIAGHYTTTGVYNAARTTDGGATWSAITVGTATTYDIAVAGYGVEFWMGRGTNIFQSTDRGATWNQSYTGTGTFYDQDFVTSGNSAYGWAVKDNGNIVMYFGTVTGIENSNDNLPEAYNLAQNYPNPFNPTTTIRFDLPTESEVTLKVYNLLGQEVATLATGVYAPGFRSTEWNGRNQFGAPVASGVYFYRLEAKPTDGTSRFTSLKKMLLVK